MRNPRGIQDVEGGGWKFFFFWLGFHMRITDLQVWDGNPAAHTLGSVLGASFE